MSFSNTFSLVAMFNLKRSWFFLLYVLYKREFGTSVHRVRFPLNNGFWNNETECWILVVVEFKCQIFVECLYFLTAEFSLNIRFFVEYQAFDENWILLNVLFLLHIEFSLNMEPSLNVKFLLNVEMKYYSKNFIEYCFCSFSNFTTIGLP